MCTPLYKHIIQDNAHLVQVLALLFNIDRSDYFVVFSLSGMREPPN